MSPISPLTLCSLCNGVGKSQFTLDETLLCSRCHGTGLEPIDVTKYERAFNTRANCDAKITVPEKSLFQRTLEHIGDCPKCGGSVRFSYCDGKHTCDWRLSSAVIQRPIHKAKTEMFHVTCKFCHYNHLVDLVNY